MSCTITFLSIDKAFTDAATRLLPEKQGNYEFKVVNSPLDVYLGKRAQGNKPVLVTPGNSFGIMTGGYDLAVAEIAKENNVDIESVVRRVIQTAFRGELVVGDAFYIAASPNLPFSGLVYAPTMRIPMKLPVGSDVPYVSTRAALLKVAEYGFVPDEVIFTAMGGNTGGVPPETILMQMRSAIMNWIDPPIVNDFGRGAEIHRDAHFDERTG